MLANGVNSFELNRPCDLKNLWAAEHRDWIQQDWKEIMFTEKSLFNLDYDSRFALVQNKGKPKCSIQNPGSIATCRWFM